MSPRPIQNVTYDFSGKVALVTGAGRGQGRCHALGFAAAGADVVIADIGGVPMETVPYDLATTDDLNDVAEEARAFGVRALPAVCDVRHREQVATLVADAMEEFGGIDVLINNAGVESIYTVADMPEEAWDEMLDTHLKGVFLMSHHVVPHMIAASNGGSIISTGSTSSSLGSPAQAHYGAAKHGIVGFTKALAIEVARHGINVNVVSPGAVDTPMVAGLMASKDAEWLQTLGELTGPWNLIEDGAMLEPEEITRAMMWLASDAARFITGHALVVDAGFTIK